MTENALQVFSYKGAEIRTVTIEGEPWFVAVDICKVLELSNPTVAIEGLEEDERAKYFLGRQGEANIISESGLYALIFRSNKLEAKQFSKWVRSEVLPTIRKTVTYSLRPNANISPNDLECASFIYQSAGIKGNQLTIALNDMYKTYSGKNALEAGEIQLEVPIKQQTWPRWKSNITLDEIP